MSRYDDTERERKEKQEKSKLAEIFRIPGLNVPSKVKYAAGVKPVLTFHLLQVMMVILLNTSAYIIVKLTLLEGSAKIGLL